MSLTGRMHTMINMPIRKALAPLQMYQLSCLSPRVSPRRSVRTVSLAGPDVQRRENHVCGRIPRTAWPHLRRKEAMRHHGAPPLRHGAPPLFRRETTLRRTVFAGMANTRPAHSPPSSAPAPPIKRSEFKKREHHSRRDNPSPPPVRSARAAASKRSKRKNNDDHPASRSSRSHYYAGMIDDSPILTAQSTSHQHGAIRGWSCGAALILRSTSRKSFYSVTGLIKIRQLT